MGLRSRGRAALIRRQKVAAGVEVTYVRGAVQIEGLTAWVGRTRFAQSAPLPGGASLIWGDRDYLIAVGDLTLGEPAEGDRIEETIEGVACVFECMVPDTGEPAWRYSDSSRTLYRLHMKQVK